MLERTRLINEIGAVAEILALAKQKHTEVKEFLPKEHNWEDWYAAFIVAIDKELDIPKAVTAATDFIFNLIPEKGNAGQNPHLDQ